MPPAKSAPKRRAAVVAKKPAANKKSKTTKATIKDEEDSEYDQSDGSEDEDGENPPSNDSNDADMELLRVAFASAKSKSLKKSNAEFLKKQQAMIDSVFEQAEAMKVAGEAHLDRLVEEMEAAIQPPDKEDITSVAVLVGQRTTVADALFDSSALSLEQISAEYDEAIQAADEEFQNRSARREKIRRQTIRQAHHILEKGVEEQKLITDATNFIKNFQRLMQL
ncbi:hypothetical protein BDV93DRAFT_517308 [Ceratobasidium sp. AG-I]|nr:hypothetical protein BDV93DRAFT_517308 [Ceratobasidium sp. AG-I]